MDLPLSSNISDFKVLHWVLDLSCDFTKQICHGSILFICRDNNNKQNSYNTIRASSDISQQQEEQNSSSNAVGDPSNRTIIFDTYAIDVEACYYYSLPKLNCETEENASFVDNSSGDNVTVQISTSLMKKYKNIYTELKTNNNGMRLGFSVEEHCLRMQVPIKSMKGQRLFAIKVVYNTKSDGPSLSWTLDQNKQRSMYTSGHLLSNRSLMPCQDAPQALSTWHFYISVSDNQSSEYQGYPVHVLATGETDPSIVNKDCTQVYGYHSSYPMPASTFALAVGSWPCCWTSDERHVDFDQLVISRQKPRLRVFCPHHLQNTFGLTILCSYLPECLSALNNVLGPYPLGRLDILIVPPGFDSMGMMSPHLLFLSQSVLMDVSESSASGSVLYRVAHELCHTWLGVLTGPQDWTEEWLTEGLCCYLEDQVHARAAQWPELEAQERLQLRTLIKYRLLKEEINATTDELQTLRPSGKPASNTEQCNKADPTVVRNGLNPEKTFMQVHYLKGFFLLTHLEHIAGQAELEEALRSFINSRLGQLFTSQDLLGYLFEKLPILSVSGLTVEKIGEEWLDSPGMPEAMKDFKVSPCNNLYAAVCKKVDELKARANRKRSKREESEKIMPGLPEYSLKEQVPHQNLLPEQIILLLGWLVEDEVKVTTHDVNSLRDELSIPEAGAEVQHSWCELIIRQKVLKWISDVEHFLIHHQAMGVYLYGELMIAEHHRFQSLAFSVFKNLKLSMSEAQQKAVQEMLYGT